jgi:hypothetical protein
MATYKSDVVRWFPAWDLPIQAGNEMRSVAIGAICEFALGLADMDERRAVAEAHRLTLLFDRVFGALWKANILKPERKYVFSRSRFRFKFYPNNGAGWQMLPAISIYPYKNWTPEASLSLTFSWLRCAFNVTYWWPNRKRKR